MIELLSLIGKGILILFLLYSFIVPIVGGFTLSATICYLAGLSGYSAAGVFFIVVPLQSFITIKMGLAGDPNSGSAL